ncbi:MAG: sensor histidine kinase [Thermoguttaceae bacterium]
MKLPPEGARWLVSLRFGACAGVFLVTTAAWLLGVLPQPLPLYAVGGVVLAYNLVFKFSRRDWAISLQSVERNILLQILFDLVALAMLLYFAGLPQNPFLSFFVFHMIIAGMYLRGNLPYLIAAAATCMVGAIMLLEYLEWIPRFDLRFSEGPSGPGLYLLTVFAALASTLWIAVYFTTAIRRYVDRAHAELRQKEKLLGIGQLVAGIAHEIANPLDGVQNCLQRIGENVRDDPRLTEYVQMMVAALDRIERTAKRVQAFALPHGVTLQTTDLNAVVEATLALLGPTRRNRVQTRTELKDVPPVQGDPYTLQEVLFNLCINALAAMPRGGTLTLRTRLLGGGDDDQLDSVAVEVADTGVGIPRPNLERIFEPFFTTRADSGGTGMGLGLCRMLISEMGGRIEVRSVVQQGTVFTVVLNPAAERRPCEHGAPAPAAAHAPCTHSKTT